jgi:hypothetical protein
MIYLAVVVILVIFMVGLAATFRFAFRLLGSMLAVNHGVSQALRDRVPPQR